MTHSLTHTLTAHTCTKKPVVMKEEVNSTLVKRGFTLGPYIHTCICTPYLP